MGFDNRSSSQPCRLKNLLLSISTVQLFISSSAFFLFEAQTADEYGISFFVSLTILSMMANILSVAWNIDKILMLIGKYEKFLEKSKIRDTSH